MEYARQSGKPILEYQTPETFADACNEFYDKVWETEQNKQDNKENYESEVLGALLLTATLTFFGCDDNTGTLGIGMLPGSDGISALTTEFPVTTRSVVADSVFAKPVQVM